MAQPEILKVAIVGVGSIGSAFAFHLAKVGRHDVTVIARPTSKRLRELERDQGIVNVSGERAEAHVRSELDEAVAYDLVLVTLKAHQVDAVLPSLNRSAAKSIQFMFNNFDSERLLNAVGHDRCCLGMPFVQASIDESGKISARVGAGGQKSIMDKSRWVEVFVAAGLPAALEPNMPLWLRCHVPLCIAFESISVAGVRRGGGASWTEAMVVAEGLQESFRLIHRLGNRLYPSGKFVLSRSPTWLVAGMFWLISRIKSFRELLATGIDECCALTDVLLAASVGVKPPVATAKIQALKPDLSI